jgi:O-antigen/teichoic acid export membrane protein
MKTTKNLYLAIGKSMLGRYSVYAANLASMMLLAHLFTPELFGTITSIMVFFLFFQLMIEAGLGPAIINLDKLDTTDRNGLFGLTLTGGAILGAIFYFLSPVFLAFYQLPRVEEVVPYGAVSLIFFAVAIVPSALLIRDQAFYRLALAGLAAEVVSTFATVMLAQWIDALHALAAKATFSAVTNFAVLYYFSRNTEFGRPVWGTKFSAIKPLLSFSAYQFGFNFINYFSRNLDNILVGKYLGAASLGVYDKAYQLMRYPLMLLTFAMTPAIQPVIRKYADDKAAVEIIHRNFTFKLSIIGAVAGVGIFLLAGNIVTLMLGPQWSGVVPIVKVLAIAIPVQVVLSTSGSFFQAMNRADLLFLSGFLSAIVMVAAIVWGVLQRDMVKLSWALVVAMHINFLQAYYIMYSRIYRKNLHRFFLNMVPTASVIVGMVLWSR